MLLFGFIGAVFAQTEVCSAEPVDRWREQLGGAQGAILAVQVERAATLLDDLHRSAPCLADVAPPDLLTRYAQLRAIQAVYEQDLLVIEEWVRVANARPLAWPVPETHPIFRFIADLDEEVAAASALEPGLSFVPPKRGGVFVDGAWAASPPASGSRHLVQVFDGDGARVDAWWQTGVVWDERYVAVAAAPEPPPWFDGPGVAADEERPDWRLARKDRLRAYERYVARQPDGEHAAEARRRIDDLVWEATPRTTAGALAYLGRFPEGRNQGGAEAVLQGAEYQLALDAGSVEALQLFLGKYPNGVYAAAARRQLDERAWVEALVDNTEQGYARYRVRWPQGAHFEEARIAQDDLAWKAVDGRGRKAVEGYLRSWPQGVHAAEARAFLKGLSFLTVSVAIDGSAPASVRDPVSAAVIEELVALGFVVAEADAHAALRVDVSELSVGQGLTRWLAAVEVRVVGSAEPLTRVEILADPGALDESTARLVDDVRAAIRALGKWRRN
jgi:hypothetical protein